MRGMHVLRQPAMLFGEDDTTRLRRLHDMLEDPTALVDVEADEIGEGQTNDFLRDIQALRANTAAAQGRRGGRWWLAAWASAQRALSAAAGLRRKET